MNRKMKEYLQQIRKQQHSKTLRVELKQLNQRAFDDTRIQKSYTMPVTDTIPMSYPHQAYQNIFKYPSIDNNTTKDYHGNDGTEKTHLQYGPENGELYKKTNVLSLNEQSQDSRAKALLEEVKAFRSMQGRSLTCFGREEGQEKQGLSVKSFGKNNIAGKDQEKENYRLKLWKQKKVIENLQKKIDHFQQLTDKLFAFIEKNLNENKPTNDQLIAVEIQNHKLEGRISQLRDQLDMQRKQTFSQIEKLSQENDSLKRQLRSAQIQLERYADELKIKEQSHRDYLTTIRIANQRLTELEAMYRQVSARAEKKSGNQEQPILKAKLQEQTQELENLREQLRVTKDQVCNCRAQLDRRVAQQLNEVEKYKALNQMVEELENLYHDVTKKSQREATKLNDKIIELQHRNTTLQQELLSNKRIIDGLKTELSKYRST